MTDTETTGEITRLLLAHSEGDRAAFDAMVPLVYQRLRKIARGQIRRGGRGGTLATTGLVHEAYLELVGETDIAWQNRSHFYAICARAMRRIVVDYARRRTAQKRGAGQPGITLDPEKLLVAGAESAEGQAELVLAVDTALNRLAAFNERLERVVECRFFAGMTDDETAAALGSSVRTVQREWQRARAWLRKELR